MTAGILTAPPHRPRRGQTIWKSAGPPVRAICRSPIILIVLLCSFYWMALTAINPMNSFRSRAVQPILDLEPDVRHRQAPLRNQYPLWVWTRCSLRSRHGPPDRHRLAPYRSCACATKALSGSAAAIFLAAFAAVDLFIPLSCVVSIGLFPTPLSLILPIQPSSFLPTWL